MATIQGIKVNDPTRPGFQKCNDNFDALNTEVGAATAAIAGLHTLVEGLAAAVTASGTNVDFTGIRADARRITVMLSGVSLSGTDDLELALGDAGGFETAGYSSLHQELIGGTVTQTSGPVDALLIGSNTAAAGNYGGRIVLRLLNASTNLWFMDSHLQQRGANVGTQISVGDKTLSDVLTQLRLQPSGANTFDAGSISILVE